MTAAIAVGRENVAGAPVVGPATAPGQPRPGCSIEGCERAHKAHGLCDPHYRRSRPRSSRRPLHPIDEALPAREVAFRQRVARAGPDECWLWTGRRGRSGHGKFVVGNRTVGAHRVAWLLDSGPIPNGLHVLHRCDNPPCVNPAHLWLGTHQDNMRDRDAKGRTTTALGQAHPQAKLTDAGVLAIRRRAAAGVSTSVLSAEYCVSLSAIRDIIARRRWRHLPNGGGAAVVGAPSTAPPLPGPALRAEMMARAAELGVTESKLLIAARTFATELGIEQPPDIDHVTDERLILKLDSWLG